jgi:hypothetical protein
MGEEPLICNDFTVAMFRAREHFAAAYSSFSALRFSAAIGAAWAGFPASRPDPRGSYE